MKAVRHRVELPAPVKARAVALCESRGLSLTEWLNDLIACALEAEATPPPIRRRHRPPYLRAVP